MIGNIVDRGFHDKNNNSFFLFISLAYYEKDDVRMMPITVVMLMECCVGIEFSNY